MYRKRAMKILITVILSFSIIVSCSFSCFAAKEYFSQDSSDWVVDTDNVFKGHYPDKNPPIAQGFSDIVYSHKELFDDYYFISNEWNDNYERVTSIEFYMPALPEENFFSSDCSSLIFSYNDLYFLLTGFDSSKLHIVEYSTTFYLYSLSGYQSAYIYSLTYPYSDWVYYGGVSVLSDGFNHPLDDFDGASVVWSNCPRYDIFEPADYISSPASDFDIFSKLFALDLNRTLSVTEGALFLELNKPVTQKLSFKDVSFLFDRFGFIIGTQSSFVYFDVDMTIYLNNELIGTADVFEYCYDGSFNDTSLSSGDVYISSYDCRMDFSETDIADNNLYIFISFSFASDGLNFIFPGDFLIVSGSELEDEKNHKTILNSIDSATSQITGSINSSTNQIKDSISSSTSQITGSVNSASSAITGAVGEVNSTLDYIKSGDVDIVQPDMNTDELDDLVSEQDEIIGNILSSLDSNVTDLLPPGYKTYREYLIDNIKSFQSDEYNNTFNFIRSTFENLVASLSIMPLLLFSLSFGFGVFALGRRLR